MDTKYSTMLVEVAEVLEVLEKWEREYFEPLLARREIDELTDSERDLIYRLHTEYVRQPND